MKTTFACGHPATEENSIAVGNGWSRCRTCKNEKARDYNKARFQSMTRDERWLAYRVRHLPEQLERARARVRHLETEAARLGFRNLLEQPQ